MAILDAVLGVAPEDQDQNIAARLFPWLQRQPQPVAAGRTPPFFPQPENPPAVQPMPRGSQPASITPAPPQPAGATGPQAVALGPRAASPAPVAMPTEAVNLGSSLDRPAPMPQAPAAAKLGARGRLEAALVGFASGDPRKAIETAQEIKNKPIAEFERQQKETQQQATTEEILARAADTRSQIGVRDAQAELERKKAANPPV